MPGPLGQECSRAERVCMKRRAACAGVGMGREGAARRNYCMFWAGAVCLGAGAGGGRRGGNAGGPARQCWAGRRRFFIWQLTRRHEKEFDDDQDHPRTAWPHPHPLAGGWAAACIDCSATRCADLLRKDGSAGGSAQCVQCLPTQPRRGTHVLTSAPPLQEFLSETNTRDAQRVCTRVHRRHMVGSMMMMRHAMHQANVGCLYIHILSLYSYIRLTVVPQHTP